MGAQRAWEIAGEAGMEARYGPGVLSVHSCIDHNDRVEFLEEGEEVEPAGSAVENADRRRKGFCLKAADRVDADSFVTHEEISNAEDKCRAGNVHEWQYTAGGGQLQGKGTVRITVAPRAFIAEGIPRDRGRAILRALCRSRLLDELPSANH